MRNLGLLILVLLAAPLNANASSVASIDTQICSGNQSTSLLDTAVFECTGNFSLIGGSISSDTSITINSDGALTLDNLILNAPLININALNGLITLGSSFTAISSDTITLTANFINILPNADLRITLPTGPVQINNGGDITLAASVPEPSNFILMLIGFTALISRKANWQKLTKKLNGLFITNGSHLDLNRCLIR